jgi:hypothetical protein
VSIFSVSKCRETLCHFTDSILILYILCDIILSVILRSGLKLSIIFVSIPLLCVVRLNDIMAIAVMLSGIIQSVILA